MSVLVLDTEVFSYLHKALKIAATELDCKNQLRSWSIYQYFQNIDIDVETTKFIISLFKLNEETYNITYSEEDADGDACYDYYNEEDYTGNIEAIQLYKYIFALMYNIEFDTLGYAQTKEFILLKKWSEDIMRNIIEATKEYENAKYSSI